MVLELVNVGLFWFIYWHTLISKVLYILTSVLVLGTPNTGRNSHFQHCCAEKLKKSKKFAATFCKKHVFLSLHQNAGRLLFIRKNVFLEKKLIFLGIKKHSLLLCNVCVFNILTSIWVLPTPKASQNMLFQLFAEKHWKSIF